MIPTVSEDLRWLGIEPDRIEYQSKRMAVHEEVTQRLKDAGLLYPCFETAEELERQRKRLAMRGKPPVYDRSALKLSVADRAGQEQEGRKPHWRFLLPNHDGDPFSPRRTDVTWNDLVRGEQTIDLASMSDPVLVREDGTWLYTLPSVADDLDFGITHVIRGEDHVTNTAAQIAIFEALGGPVPAFGHHNLLTTASGEGLSKRLGSLSIGSLRRDGYEPMAVASLAVLIGTSGPVEALRSMPELMERFEIGSVSRSSARFDVSELDGLNARLIHEMPYAQARERLALADADLGEDFWNAVRGNCVRVADAARWARAIHAAKPEIPEEDRDFLVEAAACLPPEPWDSGTFQAWANVLKEKTGRKGRALFMPLRKALTGEEHGPEMGPMLVLIGRERTLARLP